MSSETAVQSNTNLFTMNFMVRQAIYREEEKLIERWHGGSRRAWSWVEREAKKKGVKKQ